MVAYAVYIHLPFCAAKCPYCDFYSRAVVHPPFRAYLEALAAEWRAMARLATEPPPTVYIGGGTPSLWSSEHIASILSLVAPTGGSDVTVEANPGSMTPEWLEALRAAGVNRLSVGVQSMDGDRLRQLGRRHSVENARRSLVSALEAGFKSVNADIIYGTSGHTEALLCRELDALVGLGIHHLSVYELTVSPETPFGREGGGRERRAVEEERSIRLWQTAREQLTGGGYRQYEISNYAQPGHESDHNRHYWRGGFYIGLGAGAHGFIRPDKELIRYANVSDVDAYLEYWQGDDLSSRDRHGPLANGVRRIDAITPVDHARERIMLGLRTMEGVDFEELSSMVPESVQQEWQAVIQRTLAAGWAEKEGSRIVPTVSGLLRADAIAVEFF